MLRLQEIQPRNAILLLAALLVSAFFLSLFLKGLHPVFAFISGPLAPVILALVMILFGVAIFLSYVRVEA